MLAERRVIFEDQLGRRRKWAVSGALLLVLAAVVPVGIYFLGLRVAPHLPPAPLAEAPIAVSPSGSHAAYVFAANDDPPGARSIDAHVSQIDTIVPDWFRLPGSGCEVTETVDDASRRWAARRDVRVVARVANLKNDTWAKGEAGAMLASAESRRCVITTITRRARALGARGINVDLE